MNTTTTPAIIVIPFSIEADHPRCCDLYIQCIPGARLRSSIDGSRHIVDSRSGETRVPLDQSRHLAAFPKTPGMRLTVNPAALTYEITDPLHEDPAMIARVARFLKEQSGIRTEVRFSGVPPQQGTLDHHRMKTLVREMFNLVTTNEAKVCKGKLPSLQDIEDLPGHFLLNPGSRIPNTQPQYEKDFDPWVHGLTHNGG